MTRHYCADDCERDAAKEYEQKEKPMTHTPEPWKVAATPNGRGIGSCYIRSEGGRTVAVIGQGESHPDAARIVSCVNGCAGLNPAAFLACVEALKLAHAALRGFLLPGKMTKEEASAIVYDAIQQAEQP